MFTSTFKNAIIAGAIALGTLAAASGSANAGARGSIIIDAPGISIGFGDHGYRDRRYRGDRHWHDRRERSRSRRCTVRKAVRKAHRRGLRRTHVVRAGHRGVVISGRKWGERVIMGFGRHRSCPIRFVRAR